MVKILVAHPEQVADAMSIPTLENVTLAAKIGKGRLMRLLGRLLHGSAHGQSRAYFRQQLFANSQTSDFIFSQLDHGVDIGSTVRNGHFPWVPLRALHGSAAATSDLSSTQELPSRQIPVSNAEINRRAAFAVRSSPIVRTQSTEPILAVAKESRGPFMELAVWDVLAEACRKVQSRWHLIEQRKILRDYCSQKILEALRAYPELQIKETQLRSVFEEQSETPYGALHAVRAHCQRAVENAKIDEEIRKMSELRRLGRTSADASDVSQVGDIGDEEHVTNGYAAIEPISRQLSQDLKEIERGEF